MDRMHVNILEGCLHVLGNSLLDFMYGDYTGPRICNRPFWLLSFNLGDWASIWMKVKQTCS